MTHAPMLQPFARDDVPEWERSDLDEPTFLRRPRRLALIESGELEEGKESPGVSAVHWAPLKTTWSDQPPTAPGWWHVRFPDDTEYTIVPVWRDAKGVLVFTTCRHSEPVPVRRVPLAWSSTAVRAPG